MNYLPAFPPHITPLIAFGALLLVGALGGYLAHRLSWLPSITGFIAVGFIFGPGGIGLLGTETIVQARIFVDIALSLILYRLGLSLDIRMIRQKPSILAASLLESAATFGLVFFVLRLFGISAMPSMLVAAMAISSSPAVLLHVAHEVGAKGPLTEAAKTLVALNNVISFVVFSLLLPILHYSADSSWTIIIFQPFYSFAGSMILGAALAVGLHLIALKTHEAVQYKLALVIGAIMIMAGFAAELKLSVLFVPLAAGVTIKNLEKKTVISDLEFGEAFELFFILLFVFAGAGLHLHELIAYAPAVLAVVSARIVMKFLSVAAIFSIAREPVKKGIAGGLLLLPMAGLAIGLVQESNALFPQHAAVISAIVLGAVTVFETVGPPVASLAFRLAGESGANQNASDRAADGTIEINPE